MEEKLFRHLVRNAGVFFVYHRLSQMGWNAQPRTRNTRGRMSLSIVKARGAITPLAENRVIYLLRPEVARDPEN